MNVTIIGGSGFVGTRLIELLMHDGVYTCRNKDLLPSHFFNDFTDIMDVRDSAQTDEALAGSDVVVLLAAQHRDDVTPVSLYYDTNVGGMENTLKAVARNKVRHLVFFSSVAVYGLNKRNPDENHPKDPFNHYGKSKWEAEKLLSAWHEKHPEVCVTVIRPTVIFGERNRGNVYNLLRQISSGKFLMVGKGVNKKSMAYVGNVVAFVKYAIDNFKEGYNVFNYIDKPDLDMNQLVGHVGKVLDKQIPSVHFPYWIGMAGGYFFDLIAKVTGKKLPVSSVRVKKFCATTQFDSTKMSQSGFVPPYSLKKGLARTLEYEFINPPEDDVIFVSE